MLTVLEAAALKQVHPHSVRRAIAEHRLPAVRKGNMWFIARADVDAWKIVGHRPRRGGAEEQP